MTLFIWALVFLVSLFMLVKGADFLLSSAEKIGLAIGLSPFIVGVTIIAMGTSLPELVSSAVAVFQGFPEIVAANAIGSNIANILLIVGISSILARRLSVSKDLIDLDLPLIAIATAIFFVVASDAQITFFESVFLLITFIAYLGFSLVYKDDEADEEHELEALKASRPKIVFNDIFILIIGLVGLSIGSHYLIESVVNLSEMLQIGVGVITITAVAIGTSLPELLVSGKAALRHQSEMALGNIFGSNIFNILVVVGLPGLFGTIILDTQTLTVGLPMLIIATILFVFSGISRRIHVQEGSLFLLLYIIFMAKLFNLF
ncbi:MAG TPA: calcium/sodium antiporter [Candidatus Paceibacterota bacterium]|nr:calcium/sodium antiporter [Candidatus Paceibacterota bacterium]HMP18951.1 calcium/sodium antiporter [Candidatus Paceibacterota bacterium]